MAALKEILWIENVIKVGNKSKWLQEVKVIQEVSVT